MTTEEMAVYIGERLEPCPFCGDSVRLVEDSHDRNYLRLIHNVKNSICIVNMLPSLDEDDIRYWNKRAVLKAKEDKANG